MGVLNGDNGLGHMVHFIARSDACDEVPVQPVRGGQPALKRSANSPRLHGVGDVNIGEFYSPRARRFHGDGNVN